MNDGTAFTKTLGPISARFLNELQKIGKTFFSLEEAVKITGENQIETSKFLSDLIARGVLARLKQGKYIILQMGQEATQLSNWPIIARELAKPDNYYLSYLSAMRIHGMTTHPLLDVYISMPKRRRDRKISNFSYHFIYSDPNHFWGHYTFWITKQEKIYISDIERTLLDGLERPDLCGGIKEVIRGIWVKQKEIDWQKMKQYCEKFRTKAAVKRLGFILEVLNLSNDILPELVKIIFNAKDYILLDPNGSKEGKRVSRWRVRVNINIEEIRASVWA
jgi:predicted transcriptional regulator of viral defense system